MTGVTPDNLNVFDTAAVAVDDMKSLQDYTDQAQRIATVIDLNIETVDCLIRQVERVQSSGESGRVAAHGDLSGLLDSLQRVRQQHRFSAKNIAAIIHRGLALLIQVSEVLRESPLVIWVI